MGKAAIANEQLAAAHPVATQRLSDARLGHVHLVTLQSRQPIGDNQLLLVDFQPDTTEQKHI